MTEEQSFMIEAAIMHGFEVLDDDFTKFECTAEQIISLLSGRMIESEHDDLIKRLCGKYSCGPKGVREDRDFGDFTPSICKEAAKVISEQHILISKLVETLDTVMDSKECGDVD